MLVTITYAFACPICGHAELGFSARQVIINKRSLRTKPGDIGLGYIPRACQECGAALAERPDRVGIKPDDRAKVNQWRAKRGWDPLPDGDVTVVRETGPGDET